MVTYRNVRIPSGKNVRAQRISSVKISVHKGYLAKRMSVYKGYLAKRISVYKGHQAGRISVYIGYQAKRISVYIGYHDSSDEAGYDRGRKLWKK